MLRDELLARISSLPAAAEVGIRFGGELFGIDNVHRLEADGETFGILECTSADVRAMLHEWGYGPAQVKLIMAGQWANGLPAPEPKGSPASTQPS